MTQSTYKYDTIKVDDARIDDVCAAYFKWKDLNNIIAKNSARGLNMPDVISEPMGCYCLDLLWNRAWGGDATDPHKDLKVEFKATSRFCGDLSSFGLNCEFDDLVFLRFNIEENIVFVYDLKISSKEFDKLPANKKQTIKDQKTQGRRPRVSLCKLFVKRLGLKPDIVFDIRRIKILRPKDSEYKMLLEKLESNKW